MSRALTSCAALLTVATVGLIGCTPSPRVQSSGVPDAPAAGAPSEVPDDPAFDQAPDFGALVHAVDLPDPADATCPAADAVATAVGGTVTDGPTGDPASGCGYVLDQDRRASVTYLDQPIADVRADVPAPTGPGQLVVVDLDGTGGPGTFATLSGAQAPDDTDTLVLPTDDGTGCWRFATVGVGDGVAAVLVALADTTAVPA